MKEQTVNTPTTLLTTTRALSTSAHPALFERPPEPGPGSWFPPQELDPPRNLSEITQDLHDMNMRPTVHELHRMQWRGPSITHTLIDAARVLEDDAHGSPP